MFSDALNLVILVGSNRRGRFGPIVTGWFAELAEQHGDFHVDVVDVAELDLPTVLPDMAAGESAPPEAAALQRRLATADAFVAVTPEYNHGYPASLKNAIDWVKEPWRAKPIGLVSYGAAAGGLRAIEQLRQVFAELHAHTIRDTVSFPNYWEKFDSDGQPIDSTGYGAAAKVLLDQLAWWARALRDARAHQAN